MALNWTQQANYPAPLRASWAFAVDDSDRLYILAGRDESQETSGGMSRVDRFDPVTSTWDTAAALPSPLRQNAAAATDTQGRIYLIGGSAIGEPTDLQDVDRYDPSTNSWTARANLPVTRTAHDAVSDSQDRIYVAGGFDGANPTRSLYRYDPSTNSWSQLADMPTPARGAHGMAIDDEDRIYVIGGVNSSFTRLRNVDRYDPSTNSWTSIAQLPAPPREAIGTGSDRFGRIYSIGGIDNNADTIGDVVRFDPFLGAWEALTSIPEYNSTLSGDTRAVIDGSERIWANNPEDGDGNNIRQAVANDAPNAPTLDSPTENTVINLDESNRFEWTFNDPDPEDTQSQYELRYREVGAATWTTVSATATETYRDFPAATFTAGNYEWQVRTQDSLSTQGPWSSSEFFTVDSTPATPTINDPTLDQVIGTNTYEVAWSATEQDAYQLRKVADDGFGAPTSEILYDSGTVISTSQVREVSFPVNGRTEHIQVRVRENTIWSDWDSVRVTVDYTTPAEPTITLTENQAHILVEVSHPTPSGNEPNVTSQDLLRRRTGESSWTVLAEGQAPGTSYEDYTVVSEQSYEYAVISYGDNETNATSVPEPTAGVVLKGSWLHRVNDPSGSLYQFRYNTDGGSDDWTPDVTFSQFAGRRLPVAEFGEFESSSVSVNLQLDTDEEVEAFASLVKSKEILCYRDSARRKVFGIATGFRKSHTFYGGTAPLNIQEIDFTEDVS